MGAVFAAVAGKRAPVEPFVAAAPVQPVASPAAPASQVPDAQPRKKSVWLKAFRSNGAVAQALSSEAANFSSNAGQTGGIGQSRHLFPGHRDGVWIGNGTSVRHRCNARVSFPFLGRNRERARPDADLDPES